MLRNVSSGGQKTVVRQAAGRSKSAFSLFPHTNPSDQRAVLQLKQAQETADEGSFLARQSAKVSSSDSVVALGLQLHDELIRYTNHDGHSPALEGGKVASESNGAIDPRKIAAAASVIGRQTALIGELKSAHSESVKVAAALAGAVKLAQDGAIDIEDVFDVAREAIEHGSVKLSCVDAVFDLSPGDIVETRGSESAKQAAGPEIPGVSGLSHVPDSSDVLTTTLRGLRRVR